jgi:hypothetical protein
MPVNVNDGVGVGLALRYTDDPSITLKLVTSPSSRPLHRCRF